MEVDEALERWLGPLAATNGAAAGIELEARAIFVASGFTKACYEQAATFKELVPEAQRRLEEAGFPPFRDDKDDKPPDSSELFEAMAHYLGRREVLRSVLANPQPQGFMISKSPRDPIEQPIDVESPATFKDLDGWLAAAAAHHLHLQPLSSRGGVAMIGRLVAERVMDSILTTNWDAFLELGCALAGLRVINEKDKPGSQTKPGPRRPVLEVRVYDRPRDVALRPRLANGASIVKMHGGVRRLLRLLTDLHATPTATTQAEDELRGCFLIASSDLQRWTDDASWVEHHVRDVLVGRRTGFLGASCEDPAVFEAIRSTIGAWERLAPPSLGDQPATIGPPLVAFNRTVKLRLHNAFSVHLPPLGAASPPVVQAVSVDANQCMRLAFAWKLGQLLLESLDPADIADQQAREDLVNRLTLDAQAIGCDGSGVTPSVDLLCDLIAPASRWAAIAERRPPFRDGIVYPPHTAAPAEPGFIRWWYAPWSGAEHASDGSCGTCTNRRRIAWLVRDLLSLMAPPDGTPAARLAPEHEWLMLDQPVLGKYYRVWFWPWPWPWRNGPTSESLQPHLAGTLGTSPLPSGGQPPVALLCPVAVLTQEQLAAWRVACQTNGDPTGTQLTLPVGEVECPVRLLLPDLAGELAAGLGLRQRTNWWRSCAVTNTGGSHELS